MRMAAANDNLQRNQALDFTKGALVLFMVLYHWLNYFVSPTGDFYRYIRFVTPSFIFISGFPISSIYLSKYQITDARLPKRLVLRGLKILGIFLTLNLGISLLLSGSYAGQILFSLRNLFTIFISGNTVLTGSTKAAAFYILVPISYLLLLSAGLLVLGRFVKYIFHVTFLLFLSGVVVLGLAGLKSANLELLTIGLLGVLFGYVPTEKINRFVRHPYTLMGAYLGYLIAIRIYDVIYPLQVIGVCLSLMLIYLVGVKEGQPSRGRMHVILLGKYSLFGYIIQIAILQLLHHSLRHMNLATGAGTVVLSFFAAFGLTMVSVEVVDRLRRRFAAVDRLHRAVFA